MPDDSGLTLAEAARVIGTTTESVERLTAVVRPFAPSAAGLSVRQILGLHTLLVLDFVEVGDAAVIAAKVAEQAEPGRARIMVVKWLRGKPCWTWRTEEIDVERLQGPVMLLPPDRMLETIAQRCAEVRATSVRLN
jgi:hypothetical protein